MTLDPSYRLKHSSLRVSRSVHISVAMTLDPSYRLKLTLFLYRDILSRIVAMTLDPSYRLKRLGFVELPEIETRRNDFRS